MEDKARKWLESEPQKFILEIIRPESNYNFKDSDGNRCYYSEVVWRKKNNKNHQEYLDYLAIKNNKSSNTIKKMMKEGVQFSNKELHKLNSEHFCEICGDYVMLKNRHADHNHITKRFRGILCSNCNMGLGMFRDNQKIMTKAIEYLNKN